jgi:rod shape-determining protein MreC
MVVLSRYGWWIAGMASLAVFLLLAGQTGALDPLQSAYLRVSSPLEQRLGVVFRPVSDAIGDVGSINDVREENDRLRLENEDLRNQLTEFQRQTTELEELRRALGIVGASDENTYIVSTVVARDGSPFAQRVRINRGSSDGISKGDVVLSPGGSLVGTVDEVLSGESFVRLITDSQSAVNAQVQESQVSGIVAGSPRLVLNFNIAQGNINVGDTIVTSGIGGNYPAGLPIGRVAEVSGTAQDIARTVVVEPQVRMSTLSTVLVLTSFESQRLDLD